MQTSSSVTNVANITNGHAAPPGYEAGRQSSNATQPQVMEYLLNHAPPIDVSALLKATRLTKAQLNSALTQLKKKKLVAWTRGRLETVHLRNSPTQQRQQQPAAQAAVSAMPLRVVSESDIHKLATVIAEWLLTRPTLVEHLTEQLGR